jgi:hypothetical protein
MSWLRVKVGCWLLGPLLRAEIRMTSMRIDSLTHRSTYWEGRRTGALRIYQALVTRDEHLADERRRDTTTEATA